MFGKEYLAQLDFPPEHVMWKDAAEKFLQSKNDSVHFQMMLQQCELLTQNYSGMHTSHVMGKATEFSEYRHYTHGDDLKDIDWRAFARTDKLHVRKYEDERNISFAVIVDNSANMSFNSGATQKWEKIRILSFMLAYVLLNQQDSVGMVTSQEYRLIKNSHRVDNIRNIWNLLQTSNVHGKIDIPQLYRIIAQNYQSPTWLVLFSDFFCDMSLLSKMVADLHARGHRISIIQVLDQCEIHFPFKRLAYFKDMVTDDTELLAAHNIHKDYQNELELHQQELITIAGENKSGYLRIENTKQPIENVLAILELINK